MVREVLHFRWSILLHCHLLWGTVFNTATCKDHPKAKGTSAQVYSESWTPETGDVNPTCSPGVPNQCRSPRPQWRPAYIKGGLLEFKKAIFLKSLFWRLNAKEGYYCIKRDFLRDSHSTGRREPAPQNCPLTSIFPPWHI